MRFSDFLVRNPHPMHAAPSVDYIHCAGVSDLGYCDLQVSIFPPGASMLSSTIVVLTEVLVSFDLDNLVSFVVVFVLKIGTLLKMSWRLFQMATKILDCSVLALGLVAICNLFLRPLAVNVLGPSAVGFFKDISISAGFVLALGCPAILLIHLKVSLRIEVVHYDF